MRQGDVVRIRQLWGPSRGLLGLMLSGPDLMGAACAGPQAYLFDDRQDKETGAESVTARRQRHAQAMRICRQECPVRLECLAGRLADESLGTGIFGGQLFEPAPYSKVCPCGVAFTTTSRQQRYHEPACRDRLQGQRRRGRKRNNEVIAA